jgi:hypothetical protein
MIEIKNFNSIASIQYYSYIGSFTVNRPCGDDDGYYATVSQIVWCGVNETVLHYWIMINRRTHNLSIWQSHPDGRICGGRIHSDTIRIKYLSTPDLLLKYISECVQFANKK